MNPSRLLVLGSLALLTSAPIVAHDEDPAFRNVRAFLRSYEEIPAISSRALGEFQAQIVLPSPEEPGLDEVDAGEIRWMLKYGGLEGDVTQAHIHFAQRGVNGAIVVFLCSNLQGKPEGVPDCPATPGSISGVIGAANVGAGAALQGLDAGELRELVRAIRAGTAYVNVHSSLFPTGEIRGQIFANRRRDLP